MFIKKNPSITLTELLKIIDSDQQNYNNIPVDGVTSLDKLDTGLIACYHNAKYKSDLTNATSGICVLKKADAHLLPPNVVGIFSSTPYRTFGKIVSYFYPKQKSNGIISDKSQIHPSAKIGANCQIDAFVIIEAGAKIGDNAIIKSHCFIGEDVVLGNDCTLENNVSITNTIAGNRLHIKPGSRIGQQGFGFYMDEKGHFDIPQVGCVRIGSDVQIGANTTIDRGSQHDTVIGNFCRIDNLVQIAHNVELGDGCVIVSQVGIAGSSKLGKFVIAAGQVGIAGHLNIGDGVKIAAQSGIMRNIKDNDTVAGSPAIPVRDWHKQTIILQNMIKK